MIGIVGGVGPYAGIDLLKKVYDNTMATRDQDHLDTVLISMPSSINDRTAYLQNRALENPAFGIINVLKKMENIGVTVAGIPCNTAHAKGIFDVIEEELQQTDSKIKLLNMIKETVNFIKKYYPDISRIGVLSTTGVYQCSIYKQTLEQGGYEAVVPTIEIQTKYIHPAIYDVNYGIKSCSNPITQQAIDNLQQGIAYFQQQGAQAVILGCTEIPLAITGKTVNEMVTIDPTEILAKALIAQYEKVITDNKS